MGGSTKIRLAKRTRAAVVTKSRGSCIAVGVSCEQCGTDRWQVMTQGFNACPTCGQLLFLIRTDAREFRLEYRQGKTLHSGYAGWGEPLKKK
jgi:hypothetical protein